MEHGRRGTVQIARQFRLEGASVEGQETVEFRENARSCWHGFFKTNSINAMSGITARPRPFKWFQNLCDGTCIGKSSWLELFRFAGVLPRFVL